MSSTTDSAKTKESNIVDLSAAGRGVWLVKVPKYLSEKWKKSSGKGEVGKLRITRSKFQETKPEVMFTMSDEQAKQQVVGQTTATPKEHKFILTGVGDQNLVVYSQNVPDTSEGSSAEAISEHIAIEGKVIQRAECRPVADLNYLKMKKLQKEAVNKPQRQVEQISSIVNMYKPVSDHQFNKDHVRQQKETGKRIRQDKDQVMNKLFSVFEKHQYYNIQDLVRLTNQPITYLKEILKEICVYNLKIPHKNMWELKPEYRHYKEHKTS